MTMYFQLFVFSCVCALGAAGAVPANANIPNLMAIIKAAIEILRENVLSMGGNVPALNDSRRHYAAIVHVVSKEAIAECIDDQHDYYEDYQKNINKSLTDAYENPEKVIQITQTVIDGVLLAIHKKEQEIVLAAGEAATQLIQDDKDYFASSSQNLSSHNFVITGAKKLEKIVMALNHLYELMYGPICNPH